MEGEQGCLAGRHHCPQRSASPRLCSVQCAHLAEQRREVCVGNQSCCPTCLAPRPWQGLLVTVNGNPVDYHTIHPSLPLENGPAKADLYSTPQYRWEPAAASPGKEPVGRRPTELSISCLWFILHRMWFSFLFISRRGFFLPQSV